jgi:hypothetical protein
MNYLVKNHVSSEVVLFPDDRDILQDYKISFWNDAAEKTMSILVQHIFIRGLNKAQVKATLTVANGWKFSRNMLDTMWKILKVT